MSKLFVSHSSSDVKLVTAFCELLELGVGVPGQDIFCSSLPGQGVVPGTDFKSHIQHQLKHSELAIALISPHYYESAFCLCELGAVWGLSQTFVPALVPPLDFGDLRAILHGIQSVKLDNSTDLDLLRDVIDRTTGDRRQAVAKWNATKQSFIERLPSLYRSISAERKQGETFLNEYLGSFANALQAHPSELYLVLFDIDGQNQINRVHGLAFGNTILKRMPTIIAQDSCVRYSGQCGDDTFFALCVGHAQRIETYARTALAVIKERLSTDQAYVTATASAVPRSSVASADVWVTAAGEQLQEAQRRGRSTVLMTDRDLSVGNRRRTFS